MDIFQSHPSIPQYTAVEFSINSLQAIKKNPKKKNTPGYTYTKTWDTDNTTGWEQK